MSVAELRTLLDIVLDVHFACFLPAECVLQFVLAGAATLHLHCEVHARWCAQAERSCDSLQVELIHIEDVSLLMARVGLQVRSVAILGRTVQVVVLVDQLHELLLDVSKLLCGELVLIWSHLLLTQETQEAKFVLEQEE